MMYYKRDVRHITSDKDRSEQNIWQ